MSELAYRTRGDSSPQGKPRVYFSCHPDDFDKYFDLLAEEILGINNCAIYYESDWSSSVDLQNLDSRMSEMQIVVIPVTQNFLINSSNARDVEYMFAIKHHIPILPIAMEPRLDAPFSQIMNQMGEGLGDVQFLDRTLRDDTEISYEEKLESRLNSILIGDNLAARVRSAFDAYIFLSYRKKDRILAKNLMNKIHQISECRDIAIWYDEFLTPGEVWDNAISEAMSKSAVVVLAVTPNLLEPGNFIMRHEYPDARKKGKAVLPVMLMPVNTLTLRRLFRGIVEIVDGGDSEALSKALTEKLKSITSSQNRNPEHNYLIGLAYLSGIDVERNPDRAAELITDAAEQGFMEAIVKLASMYHNGDGVARDYAKEILWLAKRAEILEAQYEESKEKSIGLELITAYRDLGEAGFNVHKLPESEGCFIGMLHYAAELYLKDQDESAQQLFEISCDRLGDIAQEMGDMEKAAKWYQKSYTLRVDRLNQSIIAKDKFYSMKMGELARASTKNLNARTSLIKSYIQKGDLAESEGDLDGTRKWYQKGTEFAEEVTSTYIKDIYDKEVRVGKTGTVESWNMLSHCYEKLGDLEKRQGHLQDALGYYRKSLKIYKDLLTETRDILVKEHLGTIYSKSGSVLKEQGNLEEALGCYQKGCDFRWEVYDETKTWQSRWNLGLSYIDFALFAEKTDDIQAARKWFKEALDMIEPIIKDTHSLQLYDEGLRQAYFGLLRVTPWEEDYKEYIQLLDRGILLLEELLKSKDSSDHQDILNALKKEKKRLEASVHTYFKPREFDLNIRYYRFRKRADIVALTSNEVSYITVEGNVEREPIKIGKLLSFVVRMIHVEPDTVFEVIAFTKDGLASKPYYIKAE